MYSTYSNIASWIFPDVGIEVGRERSSQYMSFENFSICAIRDIAILKVRVLRV
jgi:hypothetical protein